MAISSNSPLSFQIISYNQELEFSMLEKIQVGLLDVDSNIARLDMTQFQTIIQLSKLEDAMTIHLLINAARTDMTESLENIEGLIDHMNYEMQETTNTFTSISMGKLDQNIVPYPTLQEIINGATQKLPHGSFFPCEWNLLSCYEFIEASK